MSGGVDSSVTAYLLKKAGHEVTGMTLKLFEVASEGPGCCGSPKDVYDAKECARALGIPHYTFNESEEFRRHVIDVFKNAYVAGETPNPCVECNRSMKFGHILELAKAWGFDAVATGHYARVRDLELSGGRGRMGLFKAKDHKKDQSYFLYMLGEEQLRSVVFPVGDLTKDEVRALASEAGLPTASKPDSQDICFTSSSGEGYRNLLGAEDGAGPIVELTSGRVLGRHGGYFNFTVGQRGGLGVAVGRPLYVTGIETATRTVYVGEDEHLMRANIIVRDLCWVNPGEIVQREIEAGVKIRYKSPEARATLALLGSGVPVTPLAGPERSTAPVNAKTCLVTFDEPQRAPAPGQFAVFYQGERVVGGGKITK